MPTLPNGSDRLFEEAWARAERIGGWLTKDQGRLLWDRALELPSGSTVVEIGSHQGRSTVVLGMAAQRRGSSVVAIDPFVEGRMFGGKATRDMFEANISAAELTKVVSLRPVRSEVARSAWDGPPIDLLYIDGKHDYWTVVDDLTWRTRCAPDAKVLIHDSFCSVGVTSALLHRVLLRGDLRYRDRVTTMAEFDLAAATRADRRRVLAEMPWFGRNVTIKLARRLHARPVLRWLKHDAPFDPY